MAVHPLNLLSLCDGYGGTELALRSVAPVRTVGRVERDSYAAAVLVERMEQSKLDLCPIWDDVDTFDGSAWRGRVDIIAAGFPCQPFSAAGQRRGTDDDRWLWPAIRRIICDVGPSIVLLENVPGLVRAGLPHVLADLAGLGFDAEWGLLSASAVGAPHRRQRFWLMADASGARRDERLRQSIESSAVGRRGVAECGFPPRPDDHVGWADWIAQDGPEPSVRRSVDESTGRMVKPDHLADRLHLLGNGLVPRCAAHAWSQLLNRGDVTP